MKKKSQTGERGFLKWIVMLVVAIIIASYFFDFNVQDAVEDERTQSNFQYIGTQIENFYNNSIKPLLESFQDSFNDFLSTDDINKDETTI